MYNFWKLSFWKNMDNAFWNQNVARMADEPTVSQRVDQTFEYDYLDGRVWIDSSMHSFWFFVVLVYCCKIRHGYIILRRVPAT